MTSKPAPHRAALAVIVVLLLAAGLLGLRITRRPTPGSSQTLMFGTAVFLRPSALPATSFKVEVGKKYEGLVRVASNPVGDRVGGGPLPIRLRLTLDLAKAVPLDAGKSVKELTFSSLLETQKAIQFVLPGLSAGHHCLIVTLLQDEKVRRGTDHFGTSVIGLHAGDSSFEHCEARRAEDGRLANAEVVAGCDFPVLSPVPQTAVMRTRFTRGSLAWAHLGSDCSQPRAVSFLIFRNGVPILDASKPLGPKSIPADGKIYTVPLGSLNEGGAYRMVVVATSRDLNFARISNRIFVAEE